MRLLPPLAWEGVGGIRGRTWGPGDVTIPHWMGGRGLAIDLAVTSPFAVNAVRSANPGEDYARKQKHRKYDADFKGADYDFCAMVFETTGSLCLEGTQVLAKIFRYAARRVGAEPSAYIGRAWAKISCCLQRSVAQSILIRCSGDYLVKPKQDFEAPLQEILKSISEVEEEAGEGRERGGGEGCSQEFRMEPISLTPALVSPSVMLDLRCSLKVRRSTRGRSHNHPNLKHPPHNW